MNIAIAEVEREQQIGTPAPSIRPTALRVAVSGMGIACLIWAVADPRSRDAEGFLATSFCLSLAAGVASLIASAFIGTRFQRFGLWLALAIVGQAASLQLIEAGKLLRYQHYLPLQRFGEQPVAAAIIAFQAAVVLIALRRHGRSVFGWATWLRETPGWWRIVLAAALVFATSAAASRDVGRFLLEACFGGTLQLIGLANVLLAAMSWPAQVKLPWTTGSPDEARHLPRCVDAVAWLGAVWVTVVSATLNVVVYERHPHVPDEVVYLLHARYFAAGRAELPAPPVPEAFDLDLMHYETGRWFSPVPPGWPAVLAVGEFLGAGWLVNPVLAGINMLLAWLLVCRLYDRGTARWVTLLLCVSPWHLFMAMSFMTHELTLTCGLSAAVAVLQSRRSSRPMLWGVLAGLAVGLAGLTRPLDGAILGVLLGLWSLGVGGPRLSWAAVAGLAVGAAALGSLTFVYNAVVTGDPLRFPIGVYVDKYHGPGKNDMGFGPNIGVGWALDPFPGHGLRDVVVNSQLNLFSLNVELLGWSIGGLLAASLVVLRCRLGRSDRLMLAVVGAVIAAHAFYWFSGGPDFGARYWFLVLVPMLVLVARSLQELPRRSHGTPEDGRNRVAVAAIALCLTTVAVYLPWRALDKYPHYRGMRADLANLAAEREFGRSLVLIQGKRFPDYASAAVLNPLDLFADETIYAWDRDPAIRARLLAAYADRPVWIIAGPSLTAAGYQLTRGPLSAREVAQTLGDAFGESHVRH